MTLVNDDSTLETIKRYVNDKVKDLESQSASSSSAKGSGLIRKKSKAKAKAKAKGKAIKHELALGGLFGPSQPITHPMPNTGIQPQLYKQQLTTPTTITPQLAPQLTQQIAQPIAQPVAAAQPTAATGAGKFKKPRAKAKSKKLKPIKEEDEEITIIKPPKMTCRLHRLE